MLLQTVVRFEPLMSDSTTTRGIEIDGENKTVEATRALRKSGGSNVVTIPQA